MYQKKKKLDKNVHAIKGLNFFKFKKSISNIINLILNENMNDKITTKRGSWI